MAIQTIGAVLQTLRGATLADLTGYAGALPGYIARVDSVGRSYIAVTTGTSTADAISYLTGTNVDWQMIVGSSDKKWLAQATWFISNVGSDENSGIDAAHPLLTVAELQRRWGPNGVLSQSTTITFSTNHAGGTLQIGRSGPDVILVVVGTVTTVTSDTVSAYADITPASNIWARLTGTAITDFTTHVNKFVKYTSGAANGMVTPIVLQSPQGVGNGVAEVCPPVPEPTVANNYFPTSANPSPGDTFNVESLVTVDWLTLDILDAAGSRQVVATLSNRPTYLLERINVTIFGAKTNATGAASRYIWGSIIGTWSDTGATALNSIAEGSLFFYIQSRVTSANYINCAFKSNASTVTSVSAVGPCSLNSSIFEGLKLIVQTGAGLISSVTFGVFNTNGVAITLASGTQFVVSNGLLGQGNATTGVSVAFDASMFVSSGSTLKLTGTSGDWRFGAVASYFTWAQTPRAHNFMSGTDTLVAGTKTITIPFLPADARITVTRNTGAGALGELTVPAASRTTGQFVVNSSSSADTSTFDWSWFSQANGVGGVFNS